MRVTGTGVRLRHGGRTIGRYGIDFEQHSRVVVWYHTGLRKYDCPAWAMDPEALDRLSVSVDTLLVPDEEHGLFRIDRDGFENSMDMIGDNYQHVAKASDSFVSHVGDPLDHLGSDLWETCDTAHSGYHVDKNEA